MDRSLETLVQQRAKWRCEYRQVPRSDLCLPFEIDHIIAEHHEGRTEARNLCFACFAFEQWQGMPWKKPLIRADNRTNYMPARVA
jgi:hypothetical protein